MFEIKNHRINIKTICSLFCIITLIATFSLCFIVSGNDNESMKITSSASHIVFNRWYDNNNIPQNINKSVDEEITYHTSIPNNKPIGSKIIIKSKNLLINSYTNGKILTETGKSKYDGYGEQYTIIDLEELGKNKEIFIHLTPLTKESSCICDSIYITTQNELVFELLQKSIFPIIITAALSILTVYFFIKGLKNIFKFKKFFYAALLTIDIIFITFYHSTLPYLLTDNGTLAYMAKYLSAMIFPLTLSLFIKEALKCKSIVLKIYELSICTYIIVRIALFAGNPSPLSEYYYTNFVLLCVLVLMTILNEKQRSTKVKNIS